jgi:ankyrin repeat protein
MPLPLPDRPSLEWLRKTAKQRLDGLRARDASARLADAQFHVAREYGFSSWRSLKRHVEARERASSAAPTPADDEIVKSFLRLVGTGRIDDVRRALAAAPPMVNAVGPHPFWGGRPQPLHVAIETRRRDLFDLLLDAGADVSGTNDRYDHWSPVMVASDGTRDDMRDELIRRGARIGLAEALMLGDDEQVEELLRPGASALPTDVPNGGSLLAFARTPFAIDRLIELGVSLDARDRWGSTPIESLSRLGPRGQTLVRHLIARGATASPEEFARLGDQDALAALVEANPDVARSDAVMMGAVDLRHHGLVEWLMARGANVNARATPPSRHTALHSAAWNGDLPLVKRLVAGGADTTMRDEEHHGTPLDWADVAIRVTNNPECRTVVEYLTGLEPSGAAGADGPA